LKILLNGLILMPKDIDLHLNVNEDIEVKINIFKDKIQEQI